MSWHSPLRPGHTHTAAFSRPVDAAVAPCSWRYASEAYKARHEEAGYLRTPSDETPEAPLPFADRAAESTPRPTGFSRRSRPGPPLSGRSRPAISSRQLPPPPKPSGPLP